MKKFVLPAVAVLCLASSAYAAPDKKNKTPGTIKCSVMTGNKVDVKKAMASHMYTDYKGRRYFFCCPGCPAAFKKDPAKFAKNASIPVPKPVKN